MIYSINFYPIMRSLVLFGLLIISNSIFCQKTLQQLGYEDITLIDGPVVKKSVLENKVIVVNIMGKLVQTMY